MQTTTEATGDLIGNKIEDTITSISKEPAKKLQDGELQSNKANNKIPKERYISLQEIQQTTEE